jgi:hypothetical protein
MSKFETYYSDIKNLLLEEDEKLSSVDQLPAEDQDFLEKHSSFKNYDKNQSKCYKEFLRTIKIIDKLDIKALPSWRFPLALFAGVQSIENAKDFFESLDSAEDKTIVQNVLQVWYDKGYKNPSERLARRKK